MPRLVDLVVDGERCCALRALGDDDSGTALVQLGDDPIGIEGLVGNQVVEFDVLDEWSDPDRIVALSGQQNEAHEIAQRIGERQDLGGQAAFGLADGLALSPPLRPGRGDGP